MTTPRSPRTEAGKADHDLAWADGDASPVSHDSAREGCEGCAFIARIEAEAAAPRSPRTEADPWEALRLDIEDAMVRGEWGQSADDADALIARHRPAIEAEAAAPRWHHSPDAPPEHFCEDCDELTKRAAAAPRSGEVSTGLREALDETLRPYLVLTHLVPAEHFEKMLDGATARLGTYAALVPVSSGEDDAYRRGFTDGRGEPPERGTVTQCPIEGVHEHTFRGPHGFREWLGAPREASEP